MKKIRVAIIGYGRSGRDIHTHLLTKLPELFEIVAYVDRDAQRRDMIKREMGIDALTDYTGLFGRDDIDLVVNASLSLDHAPISRELLLHGFNVLSEKPAAHDVAEFESVLDAARESGRGYYVFQQYRFAPAYRKIKQLIAEGTLGRIVQVSLQYDGFARRWDWQTIHGWCAGSLRNTGPHPVDMALDLMGFPGDVSVMCAMDRALTYGDGEDYVKLILTAPGAPLCDIEISSCNAYPGATFCVQGTRGTVRGGGSGLEWKYFVESEAEPHELIREPLRREDGTPRYCGDKLPMRTGEWKPTPEEANEFDAKGLAYYRAFYDTLTTGAPFEVKPEQVKLQMHVMEVSHAQNWRLFE